MALLFYPDKRFWDTYLQDLYWQREKPCRCLQFLVSSVLAPIRAGVKRTKVGVEE
jgi:hypothetical protein